MKNNLIKNHILLTAKVLTIASAIGALTACASLDSAFSQKSSALSIETIHGNTGSIASARAYETADRLMVSGSGTPTFTSPGAHADVELIDSKGAVIAHKSDAFQYANPSTTRGRHGTYHYVASFPLSDARQAAKIRVIYHFGSHANAS